jgi:hypothetical protein
MNWKASDEMDGSALGTAEQERRSAKAWCDIAAFHARNEAYWRERALAAERTPLVDRVRGLLFIAISDTIRATLWIQNKVKRWAKR